MNLIAPASRFHRVIKRLARYVDSANCNLSREYKELIANERLLGAYKGDEIVEDIAFTENAFIYTDMNSAVARRVAYADIQTVKYPLPASDSIDLIIQLTDGVQINVRVAGREGNFRDVFEIGRFFMRVAEDAGKGGPLVG